MIFEETNVAAPCFPLPLNAHKRYFYRAADITRRSRCRTGAPEKAALAAYIPYPAGLRQGARLFENFAAGKVIGITMYNIKTLNKISQKGMDRFDAGKYSCGDGAQDPDAIMVRSAAMHDMEFGPSLKAIARAGAGVNNIPIDRCSREGIVVFNTPGANANAVKELVLTAMLISSRKIIQGIEWAKTLKGQGAEVAKLVEKGKSAFVGPELKGKTLGVIGLGAIGMQVANTARHLGMEVYGYDPFLSIDAAWSLSRSVHHSLDVNEIYAECDYITIHVPCNDSTRGMINADSIKLMKDGVRIINLARGELVDSKSMISALADGKVSAYVTDFPNDDILGVDGVIAIPHLGASTPESEDNCAEMAANELIDYLENGNITNSVNLPNVSMPMAGDRRLCIIHDNKPNIIAQLSSAVSSKNINIENMMNKSKKDVAYSVLDIIGDIPEDIAGEIESIEGVIKVRLI